MALESLQNSGKIFFSYFVATLVKVLCGSACCVLRCRRNSTHSQVADWQEGHSAGAVSGARWPIHVLICRQSACVTSSLVFSLRAVESVCVYVFVIRLVVPAAFFPS